MCCNSSNISKSKISGAILKNSQVALTRTVAVTFIMLVVPFFTFVNVTVKLISDYEKRYNRSNYLEKNSISNNFHFDLNLTYSGQKFPVNRHK